MKALTLTQPWATAVACHDKRVETRSWSANYRGPLAIHAAKTIPAAVERAAMEEPFIRALHPEGPRHLPRGAVLAAGWLVGIHSTDEGRAEQVVRQHYHDIGLDDVSLEVELALGDYSPGRFAWMLDGVRALPAPIAAVGHLGLWDWDTGLTIEDLEP